MERCRNFKLCFRNSKLSIFGLMALLIAVSCKEESHIKPPSHSTRIRESALDDVIPEFNKDFKGNSIGIEAELSGVKVDLSKQASQKFGFVKSGRDPLFMLTKDMSRGYTYFDNKQSYTPYTIELVSYPCEINDAGAIKIRKDAIHWFLQILQDHITNKNRTKLGDQVSADGKFTIVITNENHKISADGSGSPRVRMSQKNMQVTIGVGARAFVDNTSPEVNLIKKAPWYSSRLKFNFLENNPLGTLEERQISANVFAYLASIMHKLADFAINKKVTFRMIDIIDPALKNSWVILPRTKPSLMLNLLSLKDKEKVCTQIRTDLTTYTNDPKLVKEIYDYIILEKGEVAGHGINAARTGDPLMQAILFEFRNMDIDISEPLIKYLPEEKR